MKKILLIIAFVLTAIPSFADKAEAAPGQSVTISVTAKGSAPFTYQWFKDGVKITDAINDRWYIPRMDAVNVGNYTCVVTNAKGSTTSDVASVSMSAVIVLPSEAVLKTTLGPKPLN